MIGASLNPVAAPVAVPVPVPDPDAVRRRGPLSPSRLSDADDGRCLGPGRGTVPDAVICR